MSNNKNFSLSFEFFPPKKEGTMKAFYETVQCLKTFDPTFMSVTYGALGTNQDKTLEIVKSIQNDYGVDTAAHFTCIGSDEEGVRQFISQLKEVGVSRMIALRGDIPSGVDKKDVLTRFSYASDLIAFIKNNYPELTLGVAGYPEGHPESTPDDNLGHLAQKVSLGADFVVTQLFFDNTYFLRFRDKARAKGIKVPIIPGIMPITHYKMIERITQMCGVKIAPKIKEFFSKNPSDKEIKDFSGEFTLKQCENLLQEGADGFHFYTLNQVGVVENVCRRLS
jgi:methylenetetrahydrofolate reductase (NADPH)